MELFSIRIQRTFQLVSTGIRRTLGEGRRPKAQKRHGAHGKMAHGRGGLRAVENKPAHVADAA